jgi:hypothetical protein
MGDPGDVCWQAAHQVLDETSALTSGPLEALHFRKHSTFRLQDPVQGSIVAIMADEIQNGGPSFGTVADVIKLLEPLAIQDREHVLRTVATWFRVEFSPSGEPRLSLAPPATKTPEDEKFSNRAVLSVKDFVFEKNPATDAERLACLAYYLTHYMETPQFKTVDLTRLNTEAAQRTFSNSAVASSNAIRDGFFVSASKAGYKQLSAMGERFVHALPDREAAQQIRLRMGVRRGTKRAGHQENAGVSESESEKI